MPFFSDPLKLSPPSLPLAWVVLLCLLWTMLGLVGHDPWKPDEAYGFGLVYSLLQGGDWIVPMLAGEAFMENPPFYYLTAAALAKVLGTWLPLHDGARLASGFYMCITLVFTGLTGRELWGKGYGRITALLMIACLGLVARTHQLIADTALLAGLSLAIYGLTLSPRRIVPAGMLIGVGTGLGFMAKGLLAPAIVASSLILLPVITITLRSRAFLASTLLALLLAAPWLVIWPTLLYQHDPLLFWEWLAQNRLASLFGMPIKAQISDHWFFLKNIVWFAWPALPLAAWTLWAQRKSMRTEWRRIEIALPLGLFLITLVLLSLFSEGRDVETLPLLPPLAILAAPAIASLRRGAANALDWFGIMTFGVIAFLLWLGWLSTLTGYPPALANWFEHKLPDYVMPVSGISLFVALTISAAWAYLTVKMQRGALRGVVNAAMGITLVWGLLATLWLPWLNEGKSYRHMIADMQSTLPADYNCMASRNLGEPQRAMLHYFASIQTLREELTPNDCQFLITQNLDPLVIEDTYKDRRILWQGSRPGDRSELFILLGKTNTID
ncbi:MAG: glycosyltransferase family 39 protein [Sulfuricellaceae bacterium]|nr:glycosyltransferase family 39 protein [Sulfuricellaceae bacterium]